MEYVEVFVENIAGADVDIGVVCRFYSTGSREQLLGPTTVLAIRRGFWQIVEGVKKDRCGEWI